MNKDHCLGMTSYNTLRQEYFMSSMILNRIRRDFICSIFGTFQALFKADKMHY